MMKTVIRFLRFVKTRLKLVTFVLVTGFCGFMIMDDFSYTLCLRLQNEFRKFKTGKEISFLRQKEDNLYKQIGQKVYLNENMNYLINELDECKEKISDMQKEITMFHCKFKERIIFEKTLKEISAAKGTTRRQAIRNLAKLNTNESLPYISMSLFDPDILVCGEAAKAINTIVDITSDEAKMLIPNFKHIQGILQVSNSLAVSTSTTRHDVSIPEQFQNNMEEE